MCEVVLGDLRRRWLTRVAQTSLRLRLLLGVFAGLLLAGPLPDLGAVAGLDDLPPPLLYVPVLDLGGPLVLLVEVVMQQQGPRELLLLLTL